MTQFEALDKYDTEWWLISTPREIVDFQLYEDRLCMPFDLFQEAVEELLGPVFTHEFADPGKLRQRLEAL